MKLLHLLSTLLFNVRAFGLLKGLKLPVRIVGRVKVYHMGCIILHCPVRRGLLTIGVNAHETSTPYTIWDNQGTVDIYGPVYLNHGCQLKNHGTIIFHGKALIGYDTIFDIRYHLELGENCSIGFHTIFTDSDNHYLVDVNSREVKRNDAPIMIGKFNWFGAYTFVKKGTVTPNYTVVASPNALLCTDYSHFQPYTILGGSPAKPLKTGVRRIYNFNKEAVIRSYFKQHPDEDTYSIPAETDLDNFCSL